VTEAAQTTAAEAGTQQVSRRVSLEVRLEMSRNST
jgi:hypothetical protein